MRISYDRSADVLYIQCDGHKEAEHITCVDGPEGILIQYDPDKKRVVGFTILHLAANGGPWAYDLPLDLDPVIAKEFEALDDS